MSTVIEIEQLRHSYGNGEVLHGIDLTVEAGAIFGFLGHNGAGKTTTLHILTTLLTPTSGRASVGGHDTVLERFAVQSSIGYVPENVRLYDHLTARENLRFFAELSGVENAPRAIDDALGFLECRDYAASGSASRRRSCTGRACSSSTSRRRASTRWASGSCATRSCASTRSSASRSS